MTTINDFRNKLDAGLVVEPLNPNVLSERINDFRRHYEKQPQYLVINNTGMRRIIETCEWNKYFEPAPKHIVLERGLVGTTFGLEVYGDTFLGASEMFVQSNALM